MKILFRGHKVGEINDELAVYVLKKNPRLKLKRGYVFLEVDD